MNDNIVYTMVFEHIPRSVIIMKAYTFNNIHNKNDFIITHYNLIFNSFPRTLDLEKK